MPVFARQLYNALLLASLLLTTLQQQGKGQRQTAPSPCRFRKNVGQIPWHGERPSQLKHPDGTHVAKVRSLVFLDLPLDMLLERTKATSGREELQTG